MHADTTMTTAGGGGSVANDFESVNGNGEEGDDGGSGAEWWVQVKPYGSTNAPVDLHYDKDEELASSFDLGPYSLQCLPPFNEVFNSK